MSEVNISIQAGEQQTQVAVNPNPIVNVQVGIPGSSEGGVSDHGLLTGLGDDDHIQYAALAGRSGGQTLNGDTQSSGNITISSTAHATKGKIKFGTSAYDETNNRLGIGKDNPSYPLDVNGQLGINGFRFAYYPNGLTDDGSTIGIGQGALSNHTFGLRNVAIGLNALAAITGGYDNVAIGSRALDVLSGNNNTNVAIGKDAGGGLTSGNGNVFIGSSAATSATSGSNNIAIGYSVALPSNTGSNQLNIGNSFYSTTLGSSTPLFSFGGTTSSFPGLKRSGTTLQVRLADDSGFTNMEAANIILTNVPEYTDNAAAISAGAVTGQLYRTGDVLKIVH